MARKNRDDIVRQAKAALIIAAMRRSILTYGELGKALGIDGVALRNEMRHVLDDGTAARSGDRLGHAA